MTALENGRPDLHDDLELQVQNTFDKFDDDLFHLVQIVKHALDPLLN